MPHQSAPWRWAIAGVLLGGAIATTVFAPARWLATALSQASGQQLQLVGAQGSIWGGTSQLVLSGGQGSVNAVALPGQVSWRVRPVWAGLSIQISADCCTPDRICADSPSISRLN